MTTEIEAVRPQSLHHDVPYAYATVAPAGRLVLTAGACPIDADGAVVAPGDVLRTTVWVASADRADLVAAWQVVREHFGEWDPPSTLLGVTVLGFPGQLVEVEATAVRRA